ncbi:MAG: dipeptidase [Lachnospirales bacterium]
MFFADLHCDTITMLECKGEVLRKNDLAIDIKRLQNYNAPLQSFAIWHNYAKINNPFEKTVKSINFYHEQVALNNAHIAHINNYTEFLENFKSYKISSFLTVEGMEAIEDNIENIQKLYDLGVRGMGLTWNNNNSIGSSCYSNAYGLTTFGLDVVNEMARLGILVDVSHLSKKAIVDVAEKTNGIIYASHSNAYDVLNHKRNLSDEELKIIADKNGVVGLNLYLPFITNILNENLSKNEFELAFLKHIEHIINVTNENIVALGTDFDGGEDFFKKANDVSDLEYLYSLVKDEFSQEIADKMFGDNFLSLLKSASI